MQTISARGDLAISSLKRSVLQSLALVLFTMTGNGCGDALEAPRDDTVPVQTSAAVIAGDTSPEKHDAIVQLRADRGDEGWVNCSGTLVSPHIVVTAKHCVSEIADKSFVCRADGEIVSDGSDAGMFGATFEPNSIYVHVGATPSNDPVARGTTIVTTDAPSACRDDLALVILNKPVIVPNYVPVRWNGKTRVGEKVTLVGYGMGEMHDTVLRRELSGIVIRELEEGLDEAHQTTPPRTFTVGGETVCSGDSGGPALSASGALVGTYSRVTGDCFVADSRNTYMLTTGFKELLSTAFSRTTDAPVLETDGTSLWDPSGQSYGTGSDDEDDGQTTRDGGVPSRGHIPIAPRCNMGLVQASGGTASVSACATFLLALVVFGIRRRSACHVACEVARSRTARFG